jgi:hypothetical protein
LPVKRYLTKKRREDKVFCALDSATCAGGKAAEDQDNVCLAGHRTGGDDAPRWAANHSRNLMIVSRIRIHGENLA